MCNIKTAFDKQYISEREGVVSTDVQPTHDAPERSIAISQIGRRGSNAPRYFISVRIYIEKCSYSMAPAKNEDESEAAIAFLCTVNENQR